MRGVRVGGASQRPPIVSRRDRTVTSWTDCDAVWINISPKCKEGALARALLQILNRVELRRIVHLVFDRMRRVLEANDLGHLQLDVAVDEIVIEHATGFEELAILVEIAERLAQRTAHRRN